MTHPLPMATLGPNGSDASYAAQAMVEEQMERLGLQGMFQFGAGAFPEYEEVQAFLKAWLPEALERINQSGSDQLQLTCPGCGRSVPLQLVLDEQLQTDLPAKEIYDRQEDPSWEWVHDGELQAQATAVPSSCPDEACGYQFGDGDAPGSLGLFEIAFSPEQEQQLEQLRGLWQGRRVGSAFEDPEA